MREPTPCARGPQVYLGRTSEHPKNSPDVVLKILISPDFEDLLEFSLSPYNGPVHPRALNLPLTAGS